MSLANSAARLVHSKEINHFRENFRKVFLALQQSSADNKDLIMKCRNLGRKLAEQGTKMHKLLEIKKKDEGLLQDLRFKLKDAWMTSETYRSREDAANRLVKQMRSELDKLKAEVNRLHLENKHLQEDLHEASTGRFFQSQSRTTSKSAVASSPPSLSASAGSASLSTTTTLSPPRPPSASPIRGGVRPRPATSGPIRLDTTDRQEMAVRVCCVRCV